MTSKFDLTRTNLEALNLENPRDIKRFTELFNVACQQSSTPEEALGLVELALDKIAGADRRPTWDPHSELFMRLGLFSYETLKRVKEDLTAIRTTCKARNEKLPAEFDARCDKIIDLTKRLLIVVFSTTEEEIADGLKEFGEEMNGN